MPLVNTEPFTIEAWVEAVWFFINNCNIYYFQTNEKEPESDIIEPNIKKLKL